MDVQRRAQAAGHGGKGAIYAAACQHLGLSHATLMRHLKEVAVKPQRKRRADAGRSSLSLADADRLSAQMMEGYRKNNKAIQSLDLSLKELRAHTGLFACTLDPDTGEIRPLSASTCARALRAYGLHPEQLLAPAPVQQLASAHPNDVWQIDASISVLFYVPDGGVSDMDKAVFYKNKPENFEKIKRQRLTRYVITDHCSGSIFVHYVAGGESTVNLAESFLRAIEPRPEQQMHGVPFYLMMDPGSAGTAGAFGNLLHRLQVQPIVNRAGNARAKGQVENAHNLVETNFESGFKFTHVPSIAWINEKAQMWMRYYNSVPKHSRHGLPRWEKWREITAQQLRLVDATLARHLLTHGPETPKVDPHLCVRFAGLLWSVRDVAGIMVGQRVAITHNPFDKEKDSAYLVQHDAQGQELLIPVPQAKKGEHGFSAEAALIGREMKSMPDTVATANRKRIERLATGTETDEGAAAARKAKALPFGGTFDPYAHHALSLPSTVALPRRGTELGTTTRVIHAEPELLTHFEAAKALTARGVAMSPDLVKALKSLHPQGIPEPELPALAARLTVRSTLRVVGGDS